jgi:dTDP-glucose pyrophosphorylase
MQLDCIVLAGGLGTRLQSVASEKPKDLGILK